MLEAREFNRASVSAAVSAWAGLFTGPNVMISSTIGLFIPALVHAFGMNRTEISGLMLISPWGVALCVPIAGRAIDRWGLRRVLIPAVAAFAAAVALQALTHNAWQLGIAFAVAAVAAAFHSSVGYAKVVSLWFSRRRGLVIGTVVALGSGGGSILMPQVAHRLMDAYGWRGAYLGEAAIILAVGLPLIFLLLRTPSSSAAESVRLEPPQEAPGLARAEALRGTLFWRLFLAILLASGSLIGTIGHAFPMLTERGFSPAIATTAVSCVFFGGLTGQLSSGFVADRINTPRIAAPYFVAAFIGLITVHSASTVPVLLMGCVLLGLGQGAEIALAAYLVSRYFGLRAFGSLYGLIFAASNIGIGIGFMVLGVIHDMTGTYALTRIVFGVAMALSAVLISTLGPYVYSATKERTR